MRNETQAAFKLLVFYSFVLIEYTKKCTRYTVYIINLLKRPYSANNGKPGSTMQLFPMSPYNGVILYRSDLNCNSSFLRRVAGSRYIFRPG
jgi:hypothetical protein